MEELNPTQITNLNSSKGLQALLSDEEINLNKALKSVNYLKSLKKLQKELIKMHEHIIENKEKVIVVFEGRDAAGKGGSIRRITERINPRHFRIVALRRPTIEEKSQWYFQRYVNALPKAGEIVFFDRSWYNRAVVEPVNGFCTQEEYQIFMNQVNDFEKMITASGIRLVKIYMSITKDEQERRFDEIKNDPLKQWKITPVDLQAQELWDEYTKYKDVMFKQTNTFVAPWKIIKGNKKTTARISAIKYLLSQIPYDTKRKV